MRHAGALPAGLACDRNHRSLSANPVTWPHQLPDCGTLDWLAAGTMIPGEGAAHGSPRRGTRVFVVSMDTSVPRQRDTSDSALVDMLMLEAPVGLALFGPDMRFRWVNAALTRLGRQAGVDGPDQSDSAELSGPANPDPSGWAGLLPSQAWPEAIATRAENALHRVLTERVPLAEAGYPAVASPAAAPTTELTTPGADVPSVSSVPVGDVPVGDVPVGGVSVGGVSVGSISVGGVSAAGGPAAGAGQSGETAPLSGPFSGCASWFPVHDATGQV